MYALVIMVCTKTRSTNARGGGATMEAVSMTQREDHEIMSKLR